MENCHENNWQEREIYWISFYKNLTNIKVGGQGSIIDRNTDSIQSSARAHMKKIVQLSKKGEFIKEWDSLKAAYTYLNVNKSAIGDALSLRRGENYLCSEFYWIYKDKYEKGEYILHKYKIVIRRVYQMNKKGIVLRIWNSASEIARYFDISVSGIIAACLHLRPNGERRTCSNFYWKYEEEREEEE